MAEFWPQVLSLFALLLLFRVTTSDPSFDITQLLLFKSSITDPLGSLRSWTANSNPCDPPHWNGIICNSNKDVFGLQLENMSLSGQLKLDPVTALPLLRTLSFANNNFTGPLPDLKQFKGLKLVYFSMNKFLGDIPDDAFDNMSSLKKVVLSMNQFSGQIPSSLTRVKPLLELWLDNNGFDGEIPDFRQVNLTIVNVSNNNLEGGIPDGLTKMNPSMFAGNKGLCGPPTTNNCSSSVSPDYSSPSSPSSSRKLNPAIVAAIVVVSIGVLLALVGATYAVIRYRNQQKAKKATTGRASSSSTTGPQPVNRQRVEQGTTTTTLTQKKAMRGTVVKEEREEGMLVFVREEERTRDDERFELDDLLKASAEVLGRGEVGSSYKALLMSGPTVVVKRFKEMNRLGREEFEEHMRRIGRLSHPNLLPLVAYYYRKEEKLLVTDFIPNGSLASLLHANRTAENPGLDWPTRLKIVKGVARGLAYLHTELSSVLPTPHGHLKSSNVLLSPTFSPLLSDYALLPLLHHPYSLSAFRCPESSQSNRLSSKSDVWSLGVLILEILTGKLPGIEHYPSTSRRVGGSGSDLANWVNSVVREEWTGEVFDGEMRRTRDGEGEMLSLLQIGLGCCEWDVSKRWELSDAVEKIEELNERDFVGDNEDYSSFGGMTTDQEEDFSFSTNKL